MKSFRVYAILLTVALFTFATTRAHAQAKPLVISLTATYQAPAPAPTGADQSIQASVTKSVKFTSSSILALVATNVGFKASGYTLIYDPIANDVGATNKVTGDFEDASSLFTIDNSGTAVQTGSDNSDTGADKQSITQYSVLTFDDGNGNSFTVDGLIKITQNQPATPSTGTNAGNTPNETITFSGSVTGFGTVVDSSGNTDNAVFSGSVSGGGSGQGS